MTEKTVIIEKYDPVLDLKSNVSFIKVICDEQAEQPIIEERVTVEYDTLSASDKIKIDEALVVLETYLPV